MADDDWFAGDDDAPPPAVKPLGKKVAEEEAPPPSEGEAPAGGGEAPAEGGEGEGEKPPEEAEEAEYLDPNKLILFKHWIRPKFLPYRYLYLYRQNYYDDVMDYLEKRARGMPREIPHAETWPERVIRMNRKLSRQQQRKTQEDLALAEKTKRSGDFFYYHTKNVFDRHFSPLLH
ncbi:unnamed protein product [Acanthoscelides obtectus]|uniref:Flightin n=1 Tax=Acanthoscelides obtectus TaxID=200917 RepID=A0A9P0JV88_ACAOB|nr:unnamed protein product [Acanthoscelides obtectus]CAK1667325.1 Flightin [Acanthoscelides obtectus]